MPTRDGVRRQLAEYRRKRDFGITAEPSGDRKRAAKPRQGRLQFVIQKHDASHLHYDWRLEVDGVMKSWAVPKGPSLDPKVKRLAMQVEDHPIEYNTFEGLIPEGQYGGGTVMLWDRGTYTADEAEDGDDEAAMRDGLRRGKLSFTMHGKRLKGSFALVQMKGAGRDGRQWLLLKHRDGTEDPDQDITAEVTTSVATGRTMEQIAGGRSRVWQSNRAGTRTRGGTKKKSAPAGEDDREGSPSPPAPSRARARPVRALEPMLARVGESLPSGDGWTFEPKFDGIRVLAYATAGAVRLITRNGNDKTRQFPEVADAVRELARATGRDVVLDGEIVALENGEPARFQQLQGRMHVRAEDAIAGHRTSAPSGLVAFDLLVNGETVLLREPWTTRRKQLEQLLRRRTGDVLRLAETDADGAAMLDRARSAGWEGLIAKRTDARYEPGVRSKSWLKLKLEHRQEFVVGGFTEPRNSREHIGALLVGYYDRGRLIYAGHVGGGFSRAGLEDMWKRLHPLERKSSPFDESPKTNEPAHWVRPDVVVEVRFNEWTSDGVLRQPIFLGVRTDKDPLEIRREPESVQPGKSDGGKRRPATSAAKAQAKRTVARPAKQAVARGATKRAATPRRSATKGGHSGDDDAIVARLREIEETGGSGTVAFSSGRALEVTNLAKPYFPDDRLTKGDLMRYYARVASAIIPSLADRPLVLKRYPNGIEGKSFYQQKAPDDAPDGVRVETITSEAGERQRRLVGGDLMTLLYTVQLGAISVDPWHARIGTLEFADYAIIDLDPGPRAPFATAVEVAHLVKEELDTLGLHAAIKTSGSRGLHIAIPLAAGTPEDAALLVAQLVATRVAARAPKIATIERSVRDRPATTIYVDYLQNIRGKTIAGVYSARARPGATVSAPIEWAEVDGELDPRDFTIESFPQRLAAAGDIWGQAMRRGNSLRDVIRKR